MSNPTLPKLDRSGSWIYVTKSGDIRETFSEDVAKAALEMGHRVYTTAEWLGQMNPSMSQSAA